MDNGVLTNCARCNLIYPGYVSEYLGGCPRCISRDKREDERLKELEYIRNTFPPNKEIEEGLSYWISIPLTSLAILGLLLEFLKVYGIL